MAVSLFVDMDTRPLFLGTLALPAATPYDLPIYDVAGRVVRRYIGTGGPGHVAIVWDGRSMKGIPQPAGTYFYEVRAGEFVESRKMLLVK